MSLMAGQMQMLWLKPDSLRLDAMCRKRHGALCACAGAPHTTSLAHAHCRPHLRSAGAGSRHG